MRGGPHMPVWPCAAVLCGFLIAVPLPLPAQDTTPMDVLAGLEGFWADGAADSIVARISPGEIRLSFKRIGPRGGTFDHTQATYLLADLFSFARTDSFFFVKYDYDPTGDDPPRAVGRWFYKGSAGVDRQARVTVELIPENGSWAISSIEARKW